MGLKSGDSVHHIHFFIILTDAFQRLSQWGNMAVLAALVQIQIDQRTNVHDHS